MAPAECHHRVSSPAPDQSAGRVPVPPIAAVRTRPVSGRTPLTAETLLALQRTIGNAATSDIIRRDTLQTVGDSTYQTETFNTNHERTKKVTSDVKNLSTKGRGATAVPISGAVPLGYDGGHVLGLSLGGVNAGYNVVPMLPGFNRRVWKGVEDDLQRDTIYAYSGLNLVVSINVDYPDAVTAIPTSLTVSGSYDAPKKGGKGTIRKTKNYGTFSQPDDIPVVPEFSASDKGVATKPVKAIYTEAAAHLEDYEKDAVGADYLGKNKHLKESPKAAYPDDHRHRPYEYLDILTLAGKRGLMPSFMPGMLFTAAQRKLILQTNKARNGGHLVSDDADDPATKPPHNLPYLEERGSVNAPEIDHIIPKSSGGSNMFSNARVVSWLLNNKEDRVKDISGLVDRRKLAPPSFPTSGTIDDKIDALIPPFLMKWFTSFTLQDVLSKISTEYPINLTQNYQVAISGKLAQMVTDGELALASGTYRFA